MALEPIIVTVSQIGDEKAARAAGASDQDIGLINMLKTRAAEFSAARNSLIAAGPTIARTNDYDLMVEYGELMNRSDSIQSKITAVTNSIDSAMNWARQTFGSAGMSDLGVAWFIPAIAIGAAIAVIGYFLNDYAKFTRKFREQQRIAAQLVQQGVDPAAAQQQAAQAVAATTPGGLFGSLFSGNVTSIIAMAGLGWLAWVAFQRYRS